MMRIIKTEEELFIEKDTIEPILIIHNLKDTLEKEFKITVRKGVTASLIEVFVGFEQKSLKRKIIIEDGASFEYLKYQDIEEKSHLDLDYNLTLNNNSILQMTSLELGLGFSENTFETNLTFDDAKLNLNGLVKLQKEATSSSSFITRHIAKNCTSDIRYKHSLDGKTKAIFEAKSIVDKKANFSSVFQNSDTILLSDDAVIFARPHLEINIDELEASHGATAGSLDEEQLLYLRSRGIPEEIAYELLLKAFENEIYDNIQDSKIKEFALNFKRNDYV